jgi:hypothetical protein
MSCEVYVLRAAPPLPALRRLSHLPGMLKFVMPEIIYAPVLSLYFEIEIILAGTGLPLFQSEKGIMAGT